MTRLCFTVTVEHPDTDWWNGDRHDHSADAGGLHYCRSIIDPERATLAEKSVFEFRSMDGVGVVAWRQLEPGLLAAAVAAGVRRRALAEANWTTAYSVRASEERLDRIRDGKLNSLVYASRAAIYELTPGLRNDLMIVTCGTVIATLPGGSNPGNPDAYVLEFAP